MVDAVVESGCRITAALTEPAAMVRAAAARRVRLRVVFMGWLYFLVVVVVVFIG